MEQITVGQRIGKRIVLKWVYDKKRKMNGFICKCECGLESFIQGSLLKKGRSKSCIHCIARPETSKKEFEKRKIKIEKRRWENMIKRCHDPKNKAYKFYGERGISVCEKWKNSFEEYLKDMGFSPYKCSIDRINNDGNYEPGNVRWATSKEQANNRTRAKK